MIEIYLFDWKTNTVEKTTYPMKFPNRYYYYKDFYDSFRYMDRNGNKHIKTINQIPKKFRTALLLEGLL